MEAPWPVPKRKEPFTSEMIRQILTVTPGTRLGRRIVNFSEHFWVMWNAHVSLEASTGFRTAEMAVPNSEKGGWGKSRASRANVTWMINDLPVTPPTVAQSVGDTSSQQG